ncbi:hypothetical protein [Streptomyces sp. NPDC101455]|uniref:hypothetical protein n=1 Tax=Streptomyces sp. NPDC101455 TaxID=3366142 RepID=UPI00382B95A5
MARWWTPSTRTPTPYPRHWPAPASAFAKALQLLEEDPELYELTAVFGWFVGNGLPTEYVEQPASRERRAHEHLTARHCTRKHGPDAYCGTPETAASG